MENPNLGQVYVITNLRVRRSLLKLYKKSLPMTRQADEVIRILAKS